MLISATYAGPPHRSIPMTPAPSVPPMPPISTPPAPQDPGQALSGLGWNIVHPMNAAPGVPLSGRVMRPIRPTPGCVNCVSGLRDSNGNGNGIKTGLTILGVLAFVAVAITVSNMRRK